jgi:hypothetical protein
MTHHANDGSASRVHRALIKQHGYCNDAGPVLAAAATLAARCANGDHNETVAQSGRVTYLAFGKRVEPGTRYCRYCSVILGMPGD